MTPTPLRLRARQWLLQEQQTPADGPYASPTPHEQQRPQSWWQVMCLTGVDYFSSLGYAPGIAALAAGALSPFATLVLVLLTLFGALPVYRRVASESPHGEGSIAMLERLLPRWGGKLFVLVLLGFAATDFTITITLSAADAAAHLIQNPALQPHLAGGAVWITLALVALLGAVFLKGFREAVGIAVALVAVYLGLNAVLVARAFAEILAHPQVWTRWHQALFANHGSVLGIAGVSLLVFPKLALGMSGFETGVAVMPLIRGGDAGAQLQRRVRGAHRLLLSAAVIMSVFLLLTSVMTTLLIPPALLQAGGEANGRALAYLAHRELGAGFGSAYDLSTIAILWFAGASAMAGLLNLVPRFLPRYGMAPDWARASRPLVLVFTAVAFLVTLAFRADVDAQGGAYATGVLVLMTSAAIAVSVSLLRARSRWLAPFVLIAAVFVYTTALNMIERPEGLQIALIFIAAIVLISVFSRVTRSTELRVNRTEYDPAALDFIAQEACGELRFIAHSVVRQDAESYAFTDRQVRLDTHLPTGDAALFLEVTVGDPSDFAESVTVQGAQVGVYRVLRVCGASVPNALAAVLLDVRDRTGKVPHIYFDWIEGNPLVYAARFLLLGEGDIAPLTHEVLLQAEPVRARRPVVHVGG